MKRIQAVTALILAGLIAGPAVAQTAAKQPVSKDAAAAMAELKDNASPYPTGIYHPGALAPTGPTAPASINCVPSLAPSTGSLSPQTAASSQPCR